MATQTLAQASCINGPPHPAHFLILLLSGFIQNLVPDGAKCVDDGLVVQRLRCPLVDTGPGANVDEVPTIAMSWLQLSCLVVVEPGAGVIGTGMEDIGSGVDADEMLGMGCLQLCSPICVGTEVVEGKTEDVAWLNCPLDVMSTREADGKTEDVVSNWLNCPLAVSTGEAEGKMADVVWLNCLLDVGIGEAESKMEDVVWLNCLLDVGIREPECKMEADVVWLNCPMACDVGTGVAGDKMSHVVWLICPFDVGTGVVADEILKVVWVNFPLVGSC